MNGFQTLLQNLCRSGFVDEDLRALAMEKLATEK